MSTLSVSYHHHAKLLAPFFKKRKRIAVYDFGCGSGELLHILPIEKVVSYEGVDINKHSISQAKKFHQSPKFSFAVNHPMSVPRINKTPIDLFNTIGVLQYVDETMWRKIIKKAHAMLRKGGIISFSCAVDHPVYRWLNIYQLFIPHGYVQRNKIHEILNKEGFKMIYEQEKGLLFSPLFSHVCVFFFDALDKLLFRTKGTLGPIGTFVRRLWLPISWLEYQLPTDYGYTLFVIAQKK